MWVDVGLSLSLSWQVAVVELLFAEAGMVVTAAVAAAVGAAGVTLISCTLSESGGRQGTDDIVEGEESRTNRDREGGCGKGRREGRGRA